MEENFYYYFLSCLWSITPLRLHEMVDYFGGAREFFEAEDTEYKRFSERTAESIKRVKKEAWVYEYWKKMPKENIRFVSCIDATYPADFMELPDYPYGIYVEGRLPSEAVKECPKLVAIVGARNCTNYGRELARQFAKELAWNGVGVISGLANGIDGAAHSGCMEGGGYTLGILGSGLQRIYPKENYKLFLSMCERGGVMSEYPPALKPYAHLFPRRNRLISMLADFVLVVEARKQSGSLITVDYALEQGKTVGAVPGRLCDLLSEGCNHLLRQGAKCVLETTDILEEFMDSTALEMVSHADVQVNLSLGLAPNEKKVYSFLSLEPQFIDDIISQCDLPVWETVSILSELEIKGVINQNPHQFYNIRR